MSKSRPLDRDRLSMVSRDVAVRDAHRCLDPVQNGTPEEMVAAVSLLFATVMNRVGIDPQQGHGLGLRLLKHQQHHEKTNKSLQSLRDFAGLRIAGQEVTYS